MTKEDNEYYAKNKEQIKARRKELLNLHPEKRLKIRQNQLKNYYKKRGFPKCIICGKEFQPSKKLKLRKCCSSECKKERIRRTSQKCYEQHKKQYSGHYKEYYEKYGRKSYQKRKCVYKEKIIAILGDSCKVCGSKDNVEYHNIKRIRHPSRLSYILVHIEDFICLCGRCHRAKTRLNQLTEEQKAKLMNI